MKVAQANGAELRETNKKVQEFIGQNELPNPNDPLAQAGTTATLKTLLKEVQDFVKAYKPLSEDLRTLVKNNEQEFGRALNRSGNSPSVPAASSTTRTAGPSRNCCERFNSPRGTC